MRRCAVRAANDGGRVCVACCSGIPALFENDDLRAQHVTRMVAGKFPTMPLGDPSCRSIAAPKLALAVKVEKIEIFVASMFVMMYLYHCRLFFSEVG